jgi:hypothetical protein
VELICGPPTSVYLPPESTTPAVPMWKFTTGVVGSGGKWATCVVYTSDKFPTLVDDTDSVPWLAHISVIFLKFQNDPNVIFKGVREDHSWKNLQQKTLWHCPFKTNHQRT